VIAYLALFVTACVIHVLWRRSEEQGWRIAEVKHAGNIYKREHSLHALFTHNDDRFPLQRWLQAASMAYQTPHRGRLDLSPKTADHLPSSEKEANGRAAKACWTICFDGASISWDIKSQVRNIGSRRLQRPEGREAYSMRFPSGSRTYTLLKGPCAPILSTT
jgi:hypothetical protein